MFWIASNGKLDWILTKSSELCETWGGHPGLPVPNGQYGLCGRKATFEKAEEEFHSLPTSVAIIVISRSPQCWKGATKDHVSQ